MRLVQMNVHLPRRISFSPLITNISTLFTTRLTCLSNAKYLVTLDSNSNYTPYFRVPNRLISLNLRMSEIHCVNSIVSEMNSKKRFIRLPRKLLLLNMTWTKVSRPPKGLFIAIYISSSRHKMDHVKCRESTIDILQWQGPEVKFNYVPKSTMVFNCHGYPSSLTFRYYLLIGNFPIYNTYPKVSRSYYKTGPANHTNVYYALKGEYRLSKNCLSN